MVKVPAARGMMTYSKERDPLTLLPPVCTRSLMAGSVTSKSVGKLMFRSSMCWMLPLPLTVMTRLVASLVANSFFVSDDLRVNFPTNPLNPIGLPCGSGFTLRVTELDLRFIFSCRPNQPEGMVTTPSSSSGVMVISPVFCGYTAVLRNSKTL